MNVLGNVPLRFFFLSYVQCNWYHSQCTRTLATFLCVVLCCVVLCDLAHLYSRYASAVIVDRRVIQHGDWLSGAKSLIRCCPLPSPLVLLPPPPPPYCYHRVIVKSATCHLRVQRGNRSVNTCLGSMNAVNLAKCAFATWVVVVEFEIKLNCAYRKIHEFEIMHAFIINIRNDMKLSARMQK